VNKGGDPSGAKQQKRLENTVAELADRYLNEHARSHNKSSTVIQIERIIEKRIKPELGNLKITELTRADIKRWHQSMSATPTEANRALAYCSKMLSLASKEWEFRTDNPCIGVKRFPEKPRERFYSQEEMSRLGAVLTKVETEKTELSGFVLLIRLLATTGMRLGEALALRWEDVDLPARVIRLQDAKAGARTVHLGVDAIELLDNIKKGRGYVITGTDLKSPLTAGVVDKAWRRTRETAKIPDGRLHDLRHTFGTYAALAGANAFVVRDMLGHKTLAMTNRYVERAADMVKATVDSVSGRVSAAMRAGDGAEIVDLTKRNA
jgi:integrase